MATITRRGSGWYAQVRRRGYPAEYRTLATRRAAIAWARAREAELDRQPELTLPPVQMTLRELLERYRDTVTPRKRGASSEAYRLNRMIASPMGSVCLKDLRPSHIAAYRDRRLQQVKPGTVRRELAVLRSAIGLARREWALGLRDNPADQVRPPVVYDARERRLRTGEWERLLEALKGSRNSELEPFIRLAVETALRRGELLKLAWSNIDMERRVVLIPDTKTGRSRTIPLTPGAVCILRSLPTSREQVFELSPTGVQQAWRRLCARARIDNLRVHDLRHEALSRFSEMGLNTPELATISGHKDVRMLLRYTHVQPRALAAKLASLTAQRAGAGDL